MESKLNLKGKLALVTGASRGIGAAIAENLAAAGADLVLNARTQSDLDARAHHLSATYGVRAVGYAGDVADSDAVEALYQRIYADFGRLDILAANAGILIDGLLGMVRPCDIRRVLDVNVAGVLNHLQAAPRLMRRQKGGSIIITSSIIGRVGNKGQALYAASKAALLGVTQSAAKELGPQGIRVNAIAPGFIETDMTKGLSAAVRQERLGAVALGRAGLPDDVADVVLFLASDLSRYVSGQIIGVDGCMLI